MIATRVVTVATHRSMRLRLAPRLLGVVVVGCLSGIIGSRSSAWAASMNADDGRIIYAEDGGSGADDVVVSRDLDSNLTKWSTRLPSAVDFTGSTLAEIKYLIMKISPRNGQELAAVQYRANGTTTAYINLLTALDNTTGWTTLAGFPIGPLAGVTTDTRVSPEYLQYVDAEVETKSGHFMVVYRNAANYMNLDFMEIGPSGVISSGSVTPPGGAPTTMPSHIKKINITPNPANDEILLAAEDYLDNLYTWLWHNRDGTVWRWQPFGAALSATAGNFDVAFEQQPPYHALIVYQNSGPKYRVWDWTDPLNFSWDQQATLVGGGTATRISLAAKPNSRLIAVGLDWPQTPDIIYGAMWDGSDTSTQCTTSTGGVSNNCFQAQSIPANGSCSNTNSLVSVIDCSAAGGVQVGWAGNTAILMYADNQSTCPNCSKALDWATWTATQGSWKIQADVFSSTLNVTDLSINLTDLAFWLQPYRTDPRHLLVAWGDTRDKLWAAVYKEEGGCSTDANFPSWCISQVQGAISSPWYLTDNSGTATRLPVTGVSGDFEGRPFSFSVNRFVAPSVALAGTNPAALALTGSNLLIPAQAPSPAVAPDIVVTELGTVMLKDDYLQLTLPANITLNWVSDLSGVSFLLNGNASTAELDTPTYVDTKTVKFHILRDLKTNDAITIRGLKLSGYTTATATTDIGPITLRVLSSATAATSIFQTDPVSTGKIQVVESLVFDNPAIPPGAVPTAFTNTGSMAGVDLLRFKFSGVGGPVKLKTLIFDLSAVSGAVTLSNAKLFRYNGGSPVEVTQAGAASISGSQIVLTLSGGDPKAQLLAGTSDTFMLRVDAASLDVGDSLSVQLSTTAGKITADGLTASPNPALEGIQNAIRGPTAGVVKTVAMTHPVSTYTSLTLQQRNLTDTAWVALSSPDTAIAQGRTLHVSWSAVGSASAAAGIEFSATGTFPGTAMTCVAGSLATPPCDIVIPAAISNLTAAKIRLTGSTTDAPGSNNIAVSSNGFTTISTLTVAAPTSAQSINAFTQVGDLSGAADLLKFTLTPAPTSPGVSLTKVRFKLVPSGGFTLSTDLDLTSVQLLKAGAALTGTAATLPAGTSDLEVTFPAQTVTAATEFTLRATVKNLASGKQLIVKIAPDYTDTSSTATAQSGDGAAPDYLGAAGTGSGTTNTSSLASVLAAYTGSEVSKTHVVSTYTSLTLQQRDLAGTGWTALSGTMSAIAVGRRLHLTWTKVGTASDPTAIQFSNNGTFTPATTMICVAGGAASGFCDWDMPPAGLSNTNAAKVRLLGQTSDASTNNISLDYPSGGFTVVASLAMDNPETQAVNAFTRTGDFVTPVELVKVTLTPSPAAAPGIAVSSLTVRFTGQNGFQPVTQLPGLSGFELWNATTNTKITLTGGAPIGGTNDWQFNFPAQTLTAPTEFSLRSKVTGLAVGQSLVVSMAPDYATTGGAPQIGDGLTPDFTAATGLAQTPVVNLAQVLGALTSPLTPPQVAKQHTVSSYAVAVSPSPVRFQDPLTIDWTGSSNVSDPTKFEYSLDGGTWTAFTCALNGTPGSNTGCTVSGVSVTKGTATSCTSSELTSVRASLSALIRISGVEMSGSCQSITPSPSAPFKVLERLQAGAPTTQVLNAFLQAGDIPGAALLKFQLAASGNTNAAKPPVDQVNVAGLAFDLSFSTTNGSLQNFLLQGPGGSFTAPTVTPGAQPGQLRVSFNTLPIRITAGSAETYTLSADAKSLGPTDSLTVTLTPNGTNVTAMGVVSQATVTAEGSPISMTHGVSTFVVDPVVSPAIVGTPMTITWKSYGQAVSLPVKVEYRMMDYRDALGNLDTSWKPLSSPTPNPLLCTPVSTTPPAAPGGSCTATVPDTVSSSAQVRVVDASNSTTPVIEGDSALFTIGGIIQLSTISAIDVNGATAGGATWLVGNTHRISWDQLGSFTTDIQLLDRNGVLITTLHSMAVTAPTQQTISWDYTVDPTVVMDGATVRVRPANAIPSQGNRDLPVDIKYAFLNVLPSGGQAIAKATVPITWTVLPGTEPVTGAYPIAAVTATVLDGAGNAVATFSPEPNTGSMTKWTPPVGMTNVHVQICKVGTTICASGQPFNVIDMWVQVPSADLYLGDTVSITWGAGLTQPIKLTLQDQTNADLLTIVPSINGDATLFSWPIPTTLSAPLTNVHVHLEQIGTPSVFANSTPFTIHGVFSALSVTPTPVKVGDALTVNWTGLGISTTKLWLSLDGGTTYTALSSFGASGADAVVTNAGTPTSYAWTNVPTSAKTSQAKIKVTQTGPSDAKVLKEAGPFSIVGELQVTQPSPNANYDINNLVGPIRLEWRTLRGQISPVRLRLLDASDQPQPLNGAGATQLVLPNLTSPAGFDWTPSTTYSSLRVEVCDNSDLSVCALSSAPFIVSGMNVEAPTSGQVFTMTATGLTVPITWRPVGGGGTADLFYRIGANGALQSIASGRASLDNQSNVYPWAITTSFANLSNQLYIVVKDGNGGPQGASRAPFTIQGAFSFPSNFIQPAKSAYAIGDAVTLQWNTIGQISAVNFGWSVDNCTTQTPIPVAANNPNDQPQPTSVPWTIPSAAVSDRLTFCVADAMSGHAPAQAISSPIVVGARFDFTSPVGGEQWASNEPHAVTWNTTGSVSNVKLELVYSTDNFVTSKTIEVDPQVSKTNTGSYGWNVTDLKGLTDTATGAPLDPQQTTSIKAKLQLSDATPGHPAVPQVTPQPFTIRYYQVTWQVVDAATGSPVSNLQVNDSTGWTNVPNFDLSGLSQPHYYPYGLQFYTAWLLTNNQGFQDFSQRVQPLPQDVAPVQHWDSTSDQTRVVKIEVASSESVTWNTKAEYHYDATANQVEISAWLEKSGAIVNTLLVGGFVEIYENGTLIRSLPEAVTPTATGTPPDASGNFKLLWDLKRDDGTQVADDSTCFARIVVRRQPSRDFSTGLALNIAVPKKILTSTTGSSGPDVSGDVALIKAATVGSASSLEAVKTAVTTTLPTQITASQTAIQGDIATAKTELSAQVDAVKTDTTAIRTETNKISSEVLPAIGNVKTVVDGIQTYLSDPNAGLPKLLDNQSVMKDQLKAQRRGGILQRATNVEVGDNVTIQYRAEGGIPVISVYDQLGAPVAIPPLSLNGGTGLYEATFPATTAGEYRVVVTEPSSTNSAGTIDSLTLVAKVPMPTPATPNDLVAISNRLATIETEMGALSQIQSSVAALDATTTQLSGQVGTLVTNLGSLTADEVRTSLAAISSKLGSVAQATDVQTALGQLTSLQASLPALQQAIQAQLSTLATSTDVQSAITQLATLQQSLTTLQNAQQTDLTTIKSNLAALQQAVPGLQASLSSLTSQLGTPAQTAEIQSALSQLASLQTTLTQLQGTTTTDLSAITTQLASLGQQLPGLQSMLTTLQGTLGTPAQAAGLQQTLNQLATLQSTLATLSQAPTTDSQAILTKLTGLEQSLPALQASVKDALGSTAQSAELQKAMAQLAELQQTIANVQQAPAADQTTLLAKMAEVKQLIAGLSGGENSAAIETLLKNSTGDILRAVEVSNRLMQELNTLGKTDATSASLEQIKQQIAGVGSRIAGLPAQVVTEVAPEVQKVAQDLHQLGAEKGYNFDGLFEMAESQAGDVKTIRSRVEELKQLMEVQRSIIEQHLNQPVVKTWFEGG